MANPFRVFRKKKKVLLAVIGVLTMISFIIIPALMQQMGARGGSGGAQSVAVKTKEFGSLTNLDLNKLGEQHQIMSRFLTTVAQRMYSKAMSLIQSGNKDLMGQAMAAYQQYQQVSALLQQLGPNDERVLVARWAAANKARKMGFSVDENSFKQFIINLDTCYQGPGELGQAGQSRVLGDAGLVEIFMQMASDTKRVAKMEQTVMMAFSDFLLSNELQGVLSSPFAGLTSAEKWSAFRRLNEKSAIEALPVKVEDYLAKVPNPTESQIVKFFTEYKEKDADVLSAEPGLKQPKRVNIEYCVAYPAGFMDEKAVTEEQIKEEYEKTKDQYYVSETLSNLPTNLTPSADFLNTIAPKAEEAVPAAPAEEAPKAEEAVPAAPAEEAPKAEEAVPATPVEAPKAEEAVPAAPAEAPKAEEAAPAAPAEAPKAEEAAPAAPVEEAAPAAPKAEEAAPAAPAEEAAPAAPVEEAAPAAPAEEAPKAEEAAPAAPAEEAPKAEANQQSSVKRPFIREVVNSDSPAAALAPKTYRPLEEVKDEVRRRVAQRIANEKMRAMVDGIIAEMDKYSKDLVMYDIEYATNPKTAKKPTSVDLKKFVKTGQIDYVSTGLISMDTFAKGPLRTAHTEGATSQQAAVQQLFGKTLLYKPSTYVDQEGSLYAVWKTEEVKAHVPALDEENIRQQVIDQWKYVEARKLAEQDAKAKMAQAQKDKKTLKEAFGDAVAAPSPFACLSLGIVKMSQNGRAPVALTQVDGLDNPGYDFMKSVAALKPGELAVLANDPQSVFYVVQMKEQSPSYDTLFQLFNITPVEEYIQSAAFEIRHADAAQQKQTEEEYGIVWVRPARTVDGDNE